MKHLLNNLSIEEKNRIREQHEGGMSLDTSKFRKLVESKLGNSKPLVNEMDMMDVSSDSDHYKSMKNDVSLPGDELMVLKSIAQRWCENQGYKMGGDINDIDSDACRTVATINRRFTHLE